MPAQGFRNLDIRTGEARSLCTSRPDCRRVASLFLPVALCLHHAHQESDLISQYCKTLNPKPLTLNALDPSIRLETFKEHL